MVCGDCHAVGVAVDPAAAGVADGAFEHGEDEARGAGDERGERHQGEAAGDYGSFSPTHGPAPPDCRNLVLGTGLA